MRGEEGPPDKVKERSDQFIDSDLVIAKGLPWAYSPQGILMKHAGAAQRYRQPTLEVEATEEELKAVRDAVAAGVVTPAPGLRAQPTTPGLPSGAPATPAVIPMTPRAKRSLETDEKSPEAKRLDDTTSPRRSHEKRTTDEASESGDEKRQKVEEEATIDEGGATEKQSRGVVRAAEGGEEIAASASPSKMSRLYPPHYAGIQAIEAHGDEELGTDLIPDELNEELFAGYGGEEDEDPPITSEEHLQLLDNEARKVEVQRMLDIPAMKESTREEVADCGGYIISTKFVQTWKHRVERGGWFRRARLVAWQFKASVDIEQTFAPTSIMVLPKMLIHLMLNVHQEFSAMTLDVKDAFLMANQPEDERAFLEVEGKVYKLVRCLPGQRSAASQWFQLFAATAKEHGMIQDLMQPTLLMKVKEIYITVHVDDVFMVGKEQSLRDYVKHLQSKGWNIEEKGPFRMGDKFHYLKREFRLGRDCCDIRCDYKQYESLAEDTDVYKKAYRKTPMDQSFAKKDESPELDGQDITKFRSVVGRLMYLAGERPDCQFAIQTLARSMAKPTQQAWKCAFHVCSYTQGTMGFGVRIGNRQKGQSVMDVREGDEVEAKEEHLIEVITDADYAGNRNDRKSTTSFQIFIDGNLMESRARAQKSVALSSGESEFVAVVAGCSDGLLIKHLWMQMTGEGCQMKVRSDSSAARAMVQRQGIGRVRHLDASLLWVQQKEKDKVLSTAAIPTELNCADIGTKNLTRKRLFGLLYMLKIVNAAHDRVGEYEYQELEHEEKMKRATKKILKDKSFHVGMIMMMSNLYQAAGEPTEPDMNPGETSQAIDWMWIALVACAVIGALSTMKWLWDYVTDIFLGMMWNYMVKTVKGRAQEIDTYKKGKTASVETQADWCEPSLEQSERDFMQNKLFQLDLYIEELQQELNELREERNQYLQELRISEAYGLKLTQRATQYRVCNSGNVIHFESSRPFYAKARHYPYCAKCVGGGAATSYHEM